MSKNQLWCLNGFQCNKFIFKDQTSFKCQNFLIRIIDSCQSFIFSLKRAELFMCLKSKFIHSVDILCCSMPNTYLMPLMVIVFSVPIQLVSNNIRQKQAHMGTHLLVPCKHYIISKDHHLAFKPISAFWIHSLTQDTINISIRQLYLAIYIYSM